MIWQHHQLTFVTIVRYVNQNCLSFAVNKQGTEFLTVWSCHMLRYKKLQFHCLACDYYMSHLKLQKLQISACWWLVSSSCNKHYLYSATPSSVYHHYWHHDVVSDDRTSQWFIKMSLAKQYFDDWPVSIKQQDGSFCRTEKNKFKSQITYEGLFNYHRQ